MTAARMAIMIAVIAACGDGTSSSPGHAGRRTSASAPAGEGLRYRSAEDKVSFDVFDGWTVRRERGSLLLVADESTRHPRNTIAVRSVAVSGDWVEERTPELVFPATERFLRSLPEAKVSGPYPLQLDGFFAAAYQAVFVPAELGARFERRHVVLVGVERVIHVVLTAPAGELEATRAIFDAVVASVREEV